MNTKPIVQYFQGDIRSVEADTIVVNLFEGTSEPGGATRAVDQALGGMISDLIAHGDFQGKEAEIATLYPGGAIKARRVLVAGLGKKEDFSLEKARRASAAALKRARELRAQRVASIVHGGGAAGFSLMDAAQATVEGALLGLYRFTGFKSQVDDSQDIESLTLVEVEAGKFPEIQAGGRAGEIIARATWLARDLVNTPPNVATPEYLAGTARRIAEANSLQITVGDSAWVAEHGMGAFLAVGKGSANPPQFIVLEYQPDRTDLETVVLVGKGITFDSGGISIKPAEKMEEMKSDMNGAATVIAAMQAVAALQLPLRVIAIAPCTENMPDGNAYRPADIITASNGKTIEIISTDAEGRLTLADALVYAGRYAPQAVIDLATLTGACVVALGQNVAAGLFATDDWLAERLLRSAAATNEKLWRMPLWDDYKEKIKSRYADVKNAGGRYSGVGSSAVFLQEFTSYPWAHLDIAGMALIDQDKGYLTAGGVGFGVRLMVDLLRRWKSQPEPEGA